MNNKSIAFDKADDTPSNNKETVTQPEGVKLPKGKAYVSSHPFHCRSLLLISLFDRVPTCDVFHDDHKPSLPAPGDPGRQDSKTDDHPAKPLIVDGTTPPKKPQNTDAKGKGKAVPKPIAVMPPNITAVASGASVFGGSPPGIQALETTHFIKVAHIRGMDVTAVVEALNNNVRDVP